jgi:RHS repeat-associated protein
MRQVDYNRIFAYMLTQKVVTYLILLDWLRKRAELFDALNRLTQAQSAAYGNITYQYNEIGNMTYNSKIGSYSYGAQPHAVIQIGNKSYTYDANGNMMHAPGKTLTYNYDNMPVSIGSATFVYDFSGQRVKKNSTIYIGKLYECTGGSCTKYIFAGSNRIAYKVGSATYYYHTDHLGSSSVITNASGTKVNELYYYPYGKTKYALDSSLTHKFTGQEEDEETGLYYYGARYYDPAIGRFISADSIVPSPGNPQNLNRYTYCLNNPVILVDPNGHVAWFVPILIGIAVGGVTSAIAGQDIGIGMLTGAITGAIFGGIGGAIKEAAVESITAKVALHAYAGAFSGGFNTAFTGGDVGINALTGGISGGLGMAAGKYLPNEFGYQLAGRTAVGGISGGLAAEMYGGDFGQGFAQGAKTAATGFMSNCASEKIANWARKGWNWIKNNVSIEYGAVVGIYDYSSENLSTKTNMGLTTPQFGGGVRFKYNAEIKQQNTIIPGEVIEVPIDVSIGTRYGGISFSSNFSSFSVNIGVSEGILPVNFTHPWFIYDWADESVK